MGKTALYANNSNSKQIITNIISKVQLSYESLGLVRISSIWWEGRRKRTIEKESLKNKATLNWALR